MRQLWMASAALILSLATAAPSFAARAEMAFEADKYSHWTVLWVTAAPGERNELFVTETSGVIRVTDSTPVTAGGFCDAQPDGSALCQASPCCRLAEVHIKADDLDDSAHAQVPNVETYLSGGSGNDVLATVVNQSNSHTEFDGGPGDDAMFGGSGIDLFLEGSTANGSDVMVGGNEAFQPLDFDYRGDEVSYEDRVNPINADLQGDRDDGEVGERDQIGSDVESIRGGAGADVLSGNASANYLDGGYGADRLSGGGGNDRLWGGRLRDNSADRLLGGSGGDYLYGGGGNDSLYGGPGSDEVHGGSGRDKLRPGPGYDRIFGGPGNDLFWTRDRRIEAVQCGAGWDRVHPDRLEQLGTDCERDLSSPRRAARA